MRVLPPCAAGVPRAAAAVLGENSAISASSAGEAVPEESLRIVAEKLGFPLIAKACYGSMGKEVYMVNDFAALRATAEELKCRPHLYQKFIAGSRGKDIRLIVIGGRCVAAMIRQSKNDYRSNIELGGVGIPVNPPKAVVEMAEKAANKGEAEIILAKHRNGPVGTVKLLFQGSITKFKNPIKTDVF